MRLKRLQAKHLLRTAFSDFSFSILGTQLENLKTELYIFFCLQLSFQRLGWGAFLVNNSCYTVFIIISLWNFDCFFPQSSHPPVARLQLRYHVSISSRETRHIFHLRPVLGQSQADTHLQKIINGLAKKPASSYARRRASLNASIKHTFIMKKTIAPGSFGQLFWTVQKGHCTWLDRDFLG